MTPKTKVDAVVHPDVAIPVQPAGPRRQLTPERRLMIAVLEDAIQCVTKHRFAMDGPRRRLFAEETQWLLSEDTQWPYSFECICDALDLDAAAVREGLCLTSDRRPRSKAHAVTSATFTRAMSERAPQKPSALAFTAEGHARAHRRRRGGRARRY